MKIRGNRKRLVAIGLVALTSVLTPISLGRIAQSAGPGATTSRRFIYTITNPDGPNAIAAYESNPDTGELIFIGTYQTGGRGTGRLIDSQSPLVASPHGTLLFAVNPGSDDISVMSINADGSLLLREGPVSSRGVEPASLALSEELLYVANKGNDIDQPNYSGFLVEDDGSLTRIKRRIGLAFGDNPTQVLFSRDGRTLIGIRFGSGGLDSYMVKPSGKLRFRSELNGQRGPFAAVFSPIVDGHLIVADARLPGATSYFLDSEAVLSPITEVSNRPERAACWVVVHSDGSRAWVANTGTNSLSLYTIGANGSLALTGTHSTAAFGRTPFEIALDSAGRFLYELNVGTGNQSIHALRVTESVQGAGLADIGSIGVPAGSLPLGLVVVTRPGTP